MSPYIKFDERHGLALDLPDGLSSGKINFIISDVLDQWVGPIPDYDRINSAIGILECAKLELYRKVASIYEDKKCLENGDVYTDRS